MGCLKKGYSSSKLQCYIQFTVSPFLTAHFWSLAWNLYSEVNSIVCFITLPSHPALLLLVFRVRTGRSGDQRLSCKILPCGDESSFCHKWPNTVSSLRPLGRFFGDFHTLPFPAQDSMISGCPLETNAEPILNVLLCFILYASFCLSVQDTFSTVHPLYLLNTQTQTHTLTHTYPTGNSFLLCQTVRVQITPLLQYVIMGFQNSSGRIILPWDKGEENKALCPEPTIHNLSDSFLSIYNKIKIGGQMFLGPSWPLFSKLWKRKL